MYIFSLIVTCSSWVIGSIWLRFAECHPTNKNLCVLLNSDLNASNDLKSDELKRSPDMINKFIENNSFYKDYDKMMQGMKSQIAEYECLKEKCLAEIVAAEDTLTYWMPKDRKILLKKHDLDTKYTELNTVYFSHVANMKKCKAAVKSAKKYVSNYKTYILDLCIMYPDGKMGNMRNVAEKVSLAKKYDEAKKVMGILCDGMTSFLVHQEHLIALSKDIDSQTVTIRKDIDSQVVSLWKKYFGWLEIFKFIYAWMI